MANISLSALDREIKSRHNVLRQSAIPALQEARGAWDLESQLEGFLLAAEFASCDAGVLVGVDTSALPIHSGLRLSYVLEKYQGERVILPMDFKSINLKRRQPKEKNWSYFSISVGKTQSETCAFLIIQNPMVPHLVAVVPRQIVRYARYFHTSPDEIEAFPVELWPYVVPMTHLVDAVKAFVQFYNTPEQGL